MNNNKSYEVKDFFGNSLNMFYNVSKAIWFIYRNEKPARLFKDGKKLSQKNMLLEAMKAGIKLDKWNAMKFDNCMTLAQRIQDIKFEIEAGLITGYKFYDDTDKEHANAAIYWMEKIEAGQLEFVL